MATLLNSGASGWEGPPPTPQQVATVIDAVFDRLNVRSGRGFCWADQVRSPQGLRGKWEQLTFALRDHQQAHPEVDDVLAAMNMLDKMGVRSDERQGSSWRWRSWWRSSGRHRGWTGCAARSTPGR
jgi:hypothetical protein